MVFNCEWTASKSKGSSSIIAESQHGGQSNIGINIGQ